MARKKGKGKGKGKAAQQHEETVAVSETVAEDATETQEAEEAPEAPADAQTAAADEADPLQIAASSSEGEAAFHDADDGEEQEAETKEEAPAADEAAAGAEDAAEADADDEQGAATAGSCADDEATVNESGVDDGGDASAASAEDAEKEAAAAAQEELLAEQAAAAEEKRVQRDAQAAPEAGAPAAAAAATPAAAVPERTAASALDRLASQEAEQPSGSSWGSAFSSWGSWGASIVSQVATEVSAAAADTYKDISSEVHQLASQDQQQRQQRQSTPGGAAAPSNDEAAGESSPSEDVAATSSSGVRASASEASDTVAPEAAAAAAPSSAAAPSVFSSFFGTVKAAVADAKFDERMQSFASAAAQAGEVVLTKAEGLAHRAETVGAKVAEGSMDALESMGKTAMTVFAEDSVDDEGGNVVVYRRPYIPFLDESAASKEAMARTGAGGAVGAEAEADAPPPVTFESVFAAAAGEASMAKLEELSTTAMVAAKASALDAALVERLVPYFATDADDETADEVADDDEDDADGVRSDSMFLTLDEAGRSRASQLVADFRVALDETDGAGASAEENMDASEAIARAAFDTTMTWLAKCRVSCMETLAEFSGKSVEELAREAGRALPPAAGADDAEADALAEVDAAGDSKPLAGSDDALAFAKRTHRMAVFRSEQINALSSAFIVAVRDIAGAAKPRIDDLMATATRLPDSGSLGKAAPIDQKEITQTLEVVDAQVTATTTDIYLDSGTGVNAVHDALHQLLPIAKAIAARTKEE